MMVEDAGKFYVVFTVAPIAGPPTHLSEADLELGPRLRTRPTPVFERYVVRRRVKLERALAEVERAGSPDDPRRDELKHQLDVLADTISP